MAESARHVARGKHMNQPTTAASPGTRFATDSFGYETAAMKSAVQPDGILVTFALGNAALSAICLVLMCFLANPWFAAPVFVTTFSLFWINLSGAMK
jgi:hypothetical protein